MSRIYFFAVMCLMSTAVYAQEWGGEIESVEIEIIKERQLTLPRANRSFDKVPPRPAEPIEPRLTYDFQPVSFQSRAFSPSLRPLRLKAEELTRLYGRTVSAGFGNYASPYAEATFSSKRNKEHLLAGRFFHRSFGTGPVDGSTSSSSQTEVSALARRFGKVLSGGGEVSYSNTSLNFYGFPNLNLLSRDALPQHFHRARLAGNLESTRKGDLQYEAMASFSYLQDRFEAAESEVFSQFSADYRLSETTGFHVAADYALIARRDENVDARPRHLLRVRPVYRFVPRERLTIEAGTQLAYDNDTIGGGRNFHIYPHASARYEVSKNTGAFARLSGTMERVSLHTLSAENPWLAPDVPILHTNKRLEAAGGLQGSSPRGMSWSVGLVAAALEHRYFFLNDASVGRFGLRYFPEVVWRTNPYAEVSIMREVRTQLKVRFDYFGYASASAGFVPWHVPQYRGEFLASVMLYKKLVVQTTSTVLGGIQAPELNSGKAVRLPAAIDLNLTFDYLISERFAVFLKGENLLNNPYQLFRNYPVRGLQVLVGATYNF